MRLAQAIALFSVFALSAAAAQHERGVVALDSVVGLSVPSAQTTPRKVFIVQLKTPSAVEQHAQIYASNAASFGAALRSTPRFSKESAAVQSYARRLVREQNRAIARVGPGVEKIYTYQYSLNGFAARMSDVDAAKMRHLPEVLHVWEDEIRPLVTDDSPRFLNLFNRESGLRGPEELDGEGVIIGVIDSGIVPDHPSLDDSRDAGHAFVEAVSGRRHSWASGFVAAQVTNVNYCSKHRRAGTASAKPATASLKKTAITN